MRPERFAYLKRVIIQVKDLPEPHRQAYLGKACKDDPELRREIESLLAHRDEPDDIMKTGAAIPPNARSLLEDTHDQQTPDLAALPGRYRGLQKCGEGGMGVVYLAEDTKLQRAVALKFLRPDFADGDEIAARFVNEARAAAALDHPNICTIYEIEELEGQTFISMAYVEGVTLQERISSGPLSVDDTVHIGLQIAKGLHEAHEKGIVHRDIKPSNLMLSSSGFVKIMDFGIAWFAQRSGIAESGMPIGTIGYMSPEQTRGEGVCNRTDTWALGVVLYEMLAGELPFTGSPDQVSHDIVHGKAKRIGSIRGEVPPTLDTLVHRCLEKNPDHRPDAVEVVRVLEALRRSSRAPEETGVLAGRRRLRVLASAGLVLLVALSATSIWRAWRQGSGAPPPVQEVRRLTAFHQERLYLGGSALSPDGRHVAVPHHGVLDVVSVDTGEERRIATTYAGRIIRVAWAPDGETILCHNGREIWFQNIVTGSSRLLFEGPANRIALSPDGSKIAMIRNRHSAISVMDASGGDPRVIQTAPQGEGLFSLAWSPNGSRIAYLRTSVGNDGERVESLESCNLEGRRVAVIEVECCLDNGDAWGSLCWLADGRLVFGRYTDRSYQTTQLYSIEVDAATGLPSGEPERFLALEGVRLRQPSASANGARLSFHREQVREELLVLELDERGDSVGVERLSSQRWPGRVGTWTRDGRSVFFATENVNGDMDILVRNLEAGVESPFVRTPQSEEPACLTPDGSELIFRQGDLFKRMSVDGGPDVTILEGAAQERILCAAAPASLCVLCSLERNAGRSEIVFRPLAVMTGEIGDEVLRVVVDMKRPARFDYELSPDGTRVAISEQSGRLRVIDLQDASETELSVLRRPQSIAWSGDSRWLCLSGMGGEAPYWMKRVPLNGGAPSLLWTSYDDWAHSPRPSPDGSRVAFAKEGWERDVWLMDVR